METESSTSSLFTLDGTGGEATFNPFEMPGVDQMDLFDLFINTNDLPEFITSPDLPLPDPSSSETTTPDSSPVSSPPSFSLGPEVIKNEPLSPGQASDGGSSGDEACFVELSKISPVKAESLNNFPGFLNPATLDVKFCNEPATLNVGALPNAACSAQQRGQPRRTLKRRRETTIKLTMSPDLLFPGMEA